MLSKVKASGPHKKGSSQYERQNELEFAIRAKSDWGKVNEAAQTGPTDAQHNTMDRLISQGGNLYNRTQLVKGGEVAYFGINGERKFVMYPDGTFETGKQFIEFQRNGWEIEMIKA